MCIGQLFSQSALNRLWQIPGSHFFSIMWWSYSSLKYLRVVRTGFGAVCPNPHKAVLFITFPRCSRVWISASVAFPSVNLLIILSVCARPSLQGVHFPHDSPLENSVKYLATSTIQLS